MMITKDTKFTLIIIFALLSSFVQAQEFKFSGYGAAGLRIYDKEILNEYNQENYYEGKFQVDVEINDNLEAQLDFRGKSADNAVELREFSVKFKYSDKFRFKFGNLKKPFGLDQLENRDKLPYIERSFANNSIEEIGYGGRSLALMAYYNYSKKSPEYPYSYNFAIFRNNSQKTGIAGRFAYHMNNYLIAVNYILLNSSNKVSKFGNGIGIDFGYEGEKDFSTLELFMVQDLEERLIRSMYGDDENVNVFGAKASYGHKFDTGADVIKDIEPFIMSSFYIPDMDASKGHVIQGVLGANFYFHKKVRLRFNADLRLTKNQFVDEYTTKESRGIIEVQVRF